MNIDLFFIFTVVIIIISMIALGVVQHQRDYYKEKLKELKQKRYLQENWQPIETAPRDGTEILIAAEINWTHEYMQYNDDKRIGKGYWVTSVWWDRRKQMWTNRLDNFIKDESVKFWMPLPELLVFHSTDDYHTHTEKEKDLSDKR